MLMMKKRKITRNTFSPANAGFHYNYSDSPARRCKSVVLSSRAYSSILAEAYANGSNESGGILLGHNDEDIWYVIEATDPGFGAYHTQTRHEMNNRYVNYVYRILSRLYEKRIYLIGFWHRHPGSMNVFSSLDDKVNTDYANEIGGGTLSFIVNFYPEPVITCYYLSLENGLYHRLPMVVDDRILTKKGFLSYAGERDLVERKEDMKSELRDIGEQAVAYEKEAVFSDSLCEVDTNPKKEEAKGMITIDKAMISGKDITSVIQRILAPLSSHSESVNSSASQKEAFLDSLDLEKRINQILDSEICVFTNGEEDLSADDQDSPMARDKAFYMNISEHIAEDSEYVGEVLGKYVPESRMYYAFWKQDESHDLFKEPSTGLIIPVSEYRCILENKVPFKGYDWFGAYVDGCWCFHRCDNTHTPIVVKETFSFVTKAFSRNNGLLETDSMMSKTAVIVGQGSVGSYVAMQLAKAGIGHLILIDGDLLEVHNLSRHYLTLEHIGEYKVNAMKKELQCINPYMEIRTFAGLVQDAPQDLFQDIDPDSCIVIATGDNRACGKVANELAVRLGAAFVAIGCWTRACTGEIFSWVPPLQLPTYGEAFDGLIHETRNEAHRAYLGQEQEADLLQFEPGIYSDLAFITEIGIKLITDILHLHDECYIRRVYDQLTNYTLVCNTNREELGGALAGIFPKPLYVTDISNGIWLKEKGAASRLEIVIQ